MACDTTRGRDVWRHRRDLRAVLLGPNGQLGYDIRAAHAKARSPFKLLSLGRDQLDVSKIENIPRVLSEIEFDVLINCTSYHKTDEVEDNAALAITINCRAVEAMAGVCAMRGARFIHVSTDYVFGGDSVRNRPFTEDDLTAPINVYGATKVLGEKLAQQAHQDTVILRVASLFGVAGASGKGGNFVETMIRLARERGTLKVVNDQIMSPTATEDIAAAVLKLIADGAPVGTYHVVNSGAASWYDFACEIVRMTGIDAEITPCRSKDFPTRAARPRYSVLNNAKTKKSLLAMPVWQDALKRYLIVKGHLEASPVGTLNTATNSSDVSFRLRYDLMTTEQAPPDVVATWLDDPLFAAYVKKRRQA